MLPTQMVFSTNIHTGSIIILNNVNNVPYTCPASLYTVIINRFIVGFNIKLIINHYYN